MNTYHVKMAVHPVHGHAVYGVWSGRGNLLGEYTNHEEAEQHAEQLNNSPSNFQQLEENAARPYDWQDKVIMTAAFIALVVMSAIFIWGRG